MKLLIMNSLDERYGSTYRIRSISNELKKTNDKVVYYEKRTLFIFKFFQMIFHSLFRSFDVLIIQKFNPLTILPMFIARIRCKHVIVDWDDWDTGLQKNVLLKLLTWVCEKLGPYIPHLIISHNPLLLSQVLQSKNSMILTQGYDQNLFQRENFSRLRNHHRTNYQFSDDDFVVGYMCTFTTGGTLDLDSILNQLSMVHNPKVHFVIIGGGDLLDSYKLKAKSIRNIQFLGHIPHEKISSYLSMLDVGLIFMESRKANLSRVSFKVIEYLASDVKVIGTMVGETQKIFGSYVHPMPLNELSRHLEDPHLIRTMQKLDTSRLLNEHAWSTILTKLDHYLGKLKNT